jgi:hypothetical protein
MNKERCYIIDLVVYYFFCKDDQSDICIVDFLFVISGFEKLRIKESLFLSLSFLIKIM